MSSVRVMRLWYVVFIIYFANRSSERVVNWIQATNPKSDFHYNKICLTWLGFETVTPQVRVEHAVTVLTSCLMEV